MSYKKKCKKQKSINFDPTCIHHAHTPTPIKMQIAITIVIDVVVAVTL